MCMLKWTVSIKLSSTFDLDISFENLKSCLKIDKLSRMVRKWLSADVFYLKVCFLWILKESFESTYVSHTYYQPTYQYCVIYRITTSSDTRVSRVFLETQRVIKTAESSKNCPSHQRVTKELSESSTVYVIWITF